MFFGIVGFKYIEHWYYISCWIIILYSYYIIFNSFLLIITTKYKTTTIQKQITGKSILGRKVTYYLPTIEASNIENI